MRERERAKERRKWKKNLLRINANSLKSNSGARAFISWKA